MMIFKKHSMQVRDDLISQVTIAGVTPEEIKSEQDHYYEMYLNKRQYAIY